MIGIGVIVAFITIFWIAIYSPIDASSDHMDIDELISLKGTLSTMPDAVSVSDQNPFYPLITTPITIQHHSDGTIVKPLYVKNTTTPSSAIEKAMNMIDIDPDEIIKTGSAKNVSLHIARTYWEQSEGVLLIEDSQIGYNLGVLATPIASYLTIPIIVTDAVDQDVRSVINDLGITTSLVCGNLTGIGKTYYFESIESVVNASIEIVEELFGSVDYITITNPIDARDINKMIATRDGESVTETYTFEGTVNGKTLLPGHMRYYFQPQTNLGSFTIPQDYKYTLVQFEGKADYQGNENPDEMGSEVAFSIFGPDRLFGMGISTKSGGIPERNEQGTIIQDKVYNELVLYDRGGETYDIMGRGILFATTECPVYGKVTLTKLTDPIYPMMKQLSALSPYLTAYHKGIIYGDPAFAFTADDDVLTDKGQTCPGEYTVLKNPDLSNAHNRHVIKIHTHINQLLAQLADIPLDSVGQLKYLQQYYQLNPVYIALVGGTIGLPQINYYSYLTPPGNDIAMLFGGGIASDVIYGNIDPIQDDFSNTADDIYTEYPNQENIVGRIIGWDIQDAQALILRSIFYDHMIDDLSTWKDKATVQTGCGTDFAQPPLTYIIYKILGGTEPCVKWPTGKTNLLGDGFQKETIEPLGYEVTRLKWTESMMKGFSDETLETIKKSSLITRMFFGKNQVKNLAGSEHVKGGTSMEESNIILLNAHGMPNGHTAGDAVTQTLGIGRVIQPFVAWADRVLPAPIISGIGNLGGYYTRSVSNLDLGPSVTIIETCFGGMIMGMYPQSAICMSYIHAGSGVFIGATTESNVPGGYLEPYHKIMLLNYLEWFKQKRRAERYEEYPDPVFGWVIYTDMFNNLGEEQDIGLAFRNAKNTYFEQDIDSTFYWVPPLELDESGVSPGAVLFDAPLSGNSDLEPNVPEHKYMSYYEYQLYGDPKFIPYIPINE